MPSYQDERERLLLDNSDESVYQNFPISSPLDSSPNINNSIDSITNSNTDLFSPIRQRFQIEDLESHTNSPRSTFMCSDENGNSFINTDRNQLCSRSPYFLINACRAVSNWMDGPVTPISPSVTPIFPKIQFFPEQLWSRQPPFFFKCLLCSFLSLWALLFFLLVINSTLAVPMVDDSSINLINCGTTVQLWLGKNERCGINATQCRVMDPDIKDFVFKCPVRCSDDSHIWSYTAVGDYEAIYRPYVIGGGDHQNSDTWNNYRADSYVCAAAIHHGYMNNREGKIGRIVFEGPKSKFEGSEGGAGIDSLSFDSWFPQSFSFDDDFPNQHKLSGNHDFSLAVIWINIVLSVIFAYFTTDGLVFYWVMMVLGFWTVVLASDPPWSNANYSSQQTISELISTSFRHFLPFILSSYVIWCCSARGMLVGLKTHLSKTILWVGGFWISAMENYTFKQLPINRLIVSDIRQQKGGFIALIIIVCVIILAAIGQALVIWRMRKFKKYFSIYLLMIFGLLLLALIPNQTLRIHHYILGLLLLPGVGFQTSPGLFYQGFLTGLFVSGIAKWDFDSILQTALQLNRGDAVNFGGLPMFKDPLIDFAGNNTISTDVIVRWYDILHETSSQGDYLNSLWNGYSLIVNDIEVYRGNSTEFELANWIIRAAETTSLDALSKVYVRLAFANLVPSIGTTGDYTKAGVIDLINANWTAPVAGPS